MSKKIIILGAVGNCIDILDTINEINRVPGSTRYQCLGFLDDDRTLWGKVIHGVCVLGGIDLAATYKDVFFVNGIGSPSSFRIRKSIIEKANCSLGKFETIIHPSASVSCLSLSGRGVVILQNVTIAANAMIGNHVTILPNSVVSHDAVIGDYTCIAGGVMVNGKVQIGKSCYLGANSCIKEDLTIGDLSLVGMGSVVINKLRSNSIVGGNPAIPLRVNIVD